MTNAHNKTSWWLHTSAHITSIYNHAQGSVNSALSFLDKTLRSGSTTTHRAQKTPSADSRVKLWFLHAKESDRNKTQCAMSTLQRQALVSACRSKRCHHAESGLSFGLCRLLMHCFLDTAVLKSRLQQIPESSSGFCMQRRLVEQKQYTISRFQSQALVSACKK